MQSDGCALPWDSPKEADNAVLQAAPEVFIALQPNLRGQPRDSEWITPCRNVYKVLGKFFDKEKLAQSHISNVDESGEA